MGCLHLSACTRARVLCVMVRDFGDFGDFGDIGDFGDFGGCCCGGGGRRVCSAGDFADPAAVARSRERVQAS